MKKYHHELAILYWNCPRINNDSNWHVARLPLRVWRCEVVLQRLSLRRQLEVANRVHAASGDNVVARGKHVLAPLLEFVTALVPIVDVLEGPLERELIAQILRARAKQARAKSTQAPKSFLAPSLLFSRGLCKPLRLSQRSTFCRTSTCPRSRSSAGFGELWVNWSFLELGGFVLLVLATFIYNEVFRIPCFKCESQMGEVEQNLNFALMQE